MSNDMVRFDNVAVQTIGGAGLPTESQWDMVQSMAAAFFRARAYPQYQTPEEITLAMLTLRDMGISPLAGLPLGYYASTDPTKRKLAFEVKVYLSALQSRIPTFEWRAVEWDDKICRLEARLRPDLAFTPAEFTLEQAQKAGLIKPYSAWQNYPRDQLFWKAMIRWIRRYAAHILLGAAYEFAIQDDVEAEALEGRAEVVEEGGGAAGVTWAPEVAEATAVPVKPEPARDWKEEFIARGKAIYAPRKATNANLLFLANEAMKGVGRTPVASTKEIGPLDWVALFKWVDERYDGEGKKRMADDEPTASGADGNGDEASPTSIDAAAPSPVGPDMFALGAPLPLAPEFPPVMGGGNTTGYDAAKDVAAHAEWMRSGDVEGLIELSIKTTQAFADRNLAREFVREHPAESGNWFVVDGACLKACGLSHALIKASDEQAMAGYLVSSATRIMLARAVSDAGRELEAHRG